MCAISFPACSPMPTITTFRENTRIFAKRPRIRDAEPKYQSGDASAYCEASNPGTRILVRDLQGKSRGKQKQECGAEGNYHFIRYRQGAHDRFEQIKPGKIHQHEGGKPNKADSGG